ncbi:hypothetical protein [Methanonatronarchaeum thermophilum]|nr:hypothetical protein [Methanonatronarchaeum thermophilum]
MPTLRISEKTKEALGEIFPAFNTGDDMVQELIKEAGYEDLLEEEKCFFVNSNKPHLPDDGTKIYKNDVVITHGPKKYGEKLGRLQKGDYVISYITGIGARALGKVKKEWNGNAVEDREQIYEQENNEYQVKVNWKIILTEEESLSPQELRETIGWKPSQAVQKISNEKEKEKIIKAFKNKI